MQRAPETHFTPRSIVSWLSCLSQMNSMHAYNSVLRRVCVKSRFRLETKSHSRAFRERLRWSSSMACSSCRRVWRREGGSCRLRRCYGRLRPGGCCQRRCSAIRSRSAGCRIEYRVWEIWHTRPTSAGGACRSARGKRRTKIPVVLPSSLLPVMREEWCGESDERHVRDRRSQAHRGAGPLTLWYPAAAGLAPIPFIRASS